MNYAKPLFVLREKVPFMELSWRLIKFIINPRIPAENLEKSDLQYVFWDYILIGSLFAAVASISALIKLQVPLAEQLSTINAIPLLLNLYLKCLTVAFFFCLIWITILKVNGDCFALKKAYIITLHFLRSLLLFVISIFSISLYVFHMFINYGHPPSVVLNGTVPQIILEIIISLSLLIWCIIRPIKKYTELKSNELITTCIIIFSIITPFYINTFFPTPLNDSVVNIDNLGKLVLKSPISANLDQCQKNKLVEVLKQNNGLK